MQLNFIATVNLFLLFQIFLFYITFSWQEVSIVILQVLENVFPHWHMVFRIGINTFPYSVKEDST